jgi:MFS family permease
MDNKGNSEEERWYCGITQYQWLVLTIASLGWVFDIYEGQIFVATMRDSMPDLLDAFSDDDVVKQWNDRAFGFFLLGGAFGGVLFGMLSDRIGRAKTMVYTILFYSMFTALSAFSQEAWQLAALRFLVAMGVGGEWAVASAMVAEVMPARSRPVTSSIFHASSVFGTLLAVGAIWLLVNYVPLDRWGVDAWRAAFVLGILPALLTLWIRWKLREPKSWTAAKDRAESGDGQPTGRVRELFSPAYLRNTAIGVTLATIGLVTFWGGHIYGKNALLRSEQNKALAAEKFVTIIPSKKDAPSDWETFVQHQIDFLNSKITLIKDAKISDDGSRKMLERAEARLNGVKSGDNQVQSKAIQKTYDWMKRDVFERHKSTIKNAEMTSMALNTVGAGLGLVLFGSISTRLGRKGAFVLYHAMAFVMMLVMFKWLLPNNASETVLKICLPVFGFFTVGMHAGYAVYFPELYPTRLRGTGAGFCFNMGRLGTAAAFFGFGAMASPLSQEVKAMWLAPLFLLGVVVVLFARETRGEDLPE